MNIGILIHLMENIEEKFEQAAKIGFSNCQLVCWDMDLMTDEMAERVLRISMATGIEITAFWCGWPGPKAWNFTEGPLTLGLIPAEYRHIRTEALRKGSDFTKKISVKYMVTHAGFLPEDLNSREYQEVLSALKYVVQRCRENGQVFLFETGQETPTTLKRTIEDIGLDNVGINLDPANLLMYGKGNPTDALDVFGEYVFGVHAKDGEYPADGKMLGKEMPLGKGRVNFPVLIKKLRALGYEGALTIEREISGEKQLEDIKNAKKTLQELLEC